MADGNESDSTETKEEGATASTTVNTHSVVHTDAPVNSFGSLFISI